MKEKPAVGSPFFRAFPSDRIPEAVKEVNMHFFYSQLLYYRYYTSKFQKHFEAIAYSEQYSRLILNRILHQCYS